MRKRLLSAIENRLGNRKLIWFGTRAEDAESLGDIPQFAASYSLVGALTSRPSLESVSLEQIDGVRRDLDTFDLDKHLHYEGITLLRNSMLLTLSHPCSVVAYRPSVFLSALGFARQDRCQYLGMFKGQQDAFEHKPWVESLVAKLGIPAIKWRYIPDREYLETRSMFESGSVMLRRSRTSGGVGIQRVNNPSDLQASWPVEDEAFVSVSHYIAEGIPLNVGAVIWENAVTVHRVSIQLIGLESCTTRPFGYCGNDFASASKLDPKILDQLELFTKQIGTHFRGLGYLGAFGVDFLLKDGVPLFTEVNPRFQGSTQLSSFLSVERGEPCIITEHVAAFLGVDPTVDRPLRELMADEVDRASLVMHNVSGKDMRLDPRRMIDRFRELGSLVQASVVTDPSLVTEANATTARITVRGGLTDTGFELHDKYVRAMADPQSPQ